MTGNSGEKLEILNRTSCVALIDEKDHYRITVVLRSDASPYVIRLQKIHGLWCASYNQGWQQDYIAWATDTAEKIKQFAEKINVFLIREVSCFEHGFLRLDFRLRPRFLDGWLKERRNEAEKAYGQLKTFIEAELDVILAESEYDEKLGRAWVSDYFFTEEPEALELQIGWAFSVIEHPYPEGILASRRGVLKAIGANAAGALLGSTLKKSSLPEAFAKEVIGTPEVSSGYRITIEINGQRIPARPLELIKQMKLWERYYANEFALKTWYYWQSQNMPLDQAARKAAQDLENILNQLGAQYYVSWRIRDQVKEVRDNGDGTGIVRIRPIITDELYWSTPYPDNHWMVREGIARSYPPDHLHWVVGGQSGVWVTIEPPPQTCSNPFGGQCETSCLVGCETACEGSPCLFSCQSGCQTWCETSCQTCANNWVFCNYSLSCDCTDNGDGTVTVSGRVCYNTPSGCRPQAGETVFIYHAAWGSNFAVTTDSQGYYRLTKPKPAGSTPIWVRWTDPKGVEHECSTSACLCPSGTKPCPDGSCVDATNGCCSDSDCPPGYRCVNGTCQPGGGCTSDADCPPGYICVNGQCVPSTDTLTFSNLNVNLDGICSTGISVSGRLTRDNAGVRGKVELYINGQRVACTMTDVSGNPPTGYFSLSVPKSAYDSLLDCSRATSVTVKATECATGDCNGGCTGTVISKTYSASNCCSTPASVTCSVSATQVNSGQSVVFNGYVKDASGRGVPNEPVGIYLDGNLIATVTTDSTGRFSKSVTITCSSNIYHTLEARVGSLKCSKQVQCVPAPKQYAVGVSYVDTFWGNEFVVYVYDPTKQSTDYKPNDLEYTYIPTSTIAYVYYRGKTWHTITDRFSVAPAWTTNPDNITCYLVQEFCSTKWALSSEVKADLEYRGSHNLSDAGVSSAEITAILNHVDYPASEVYRKWFYEEKVPPECNDVTPNCSNSTALYQEEGTFFKKKKYLKVVTFTVY